MEYITGNKFKKFCNYYFEGGDLILNKPADNNEIVKIFIKTDFIDLFFNKFNFNYKFIIFTHNSDYGINSNHLKYLNTPNVVSWYAQNIDIIHPKLKSIPIGIANEEWPHGDISTIESVRSENLEKNNLIYANFNIYTNINERSRCVDFLNKNNIKISPPTQFKQYLQDLSVSYFSISPNGNGVDCHKTWESLYLKTIPIVTKSTNSLQYKNLPLVIIDDWSDFSIHDFNIELYNSLWYNVDINELNFTNYVSSILHS